MDLGSLAARLVLASKTLTEKSSKKPEAELTTFPPVAAGADGAARIHELDAGPGWSSLVAL